MRLATLNQKLLSQINLINQLNERLGIELVISVIPPPQLKRLSSPYDERFYIGCIENLNIIISYLNSSVQYMNEQVGFVNVETGRPVFGFYRYIRLPIGLNDAEKLVEQYCTQIDDTIDDYKQVINMNLGVDHTTT